MNKLTNKNKFEKNDITCKIKFIIFHLVVGPVWKVPGPEMVPGCSLRPLIQIILVTQLRPLN